MNSNNQTVWQQPLVDPTTGNTYFWDMGVLSCSGGYSSDETKCGEAYSEQANRVFCAISKPMRYAPQMQVGNPPYRPQNLTTANGTPISDDRQWNETWTAPTSGSIRTVNQNSRKALYSRPAPFLYTPGTSNDALAMANSMLYSAQTALTTQGVLNLLLQSVLQSRAQNLSQFQAALATPLAQFAADQTKPIGDLLRMPEVIPMMPLKPLMFGTAATQVRGNYQRDNGYLNPLMLLLSDCTQLPPMYRGNLSGFGAALLVSDMSCVSMPAVQAPSVAAIQNTVFTGYGKGPPGAVGTGGSYAQYPFAIDFGSTEASIGAAGKMAATVMYNGTLVADSGQPLGAFFRVNGPMNRLTNAFLQTALSALNVSTNSMPRATMLYVRDMPSQGISIKLDVGTFLGPLFYTWLSQMLLPVIVGLLVYEKEKNLRTMMKIQGLGDSAYMLVNYFYYFLLYFVFMLLIYLYGAGLGFGTNSLTMWTRSQPGVVIIFFILFINVQISTAFLFQAIFSSAKTATVGSVVYLLISGLLGKFLFESFLESSTFGRNGIVGMELLVPFSLYRGVSALSR